MLTYDLEFLKEITFETDDHLEDAENAFFFFVSVESQGNILEIELPPFLLALQNVLYIFFITVHTKLIRNTVLLA